MADPTANTESTDSIAPGDHAEFLSDRQTEKGPSAGQVVFVNGTQVAIRHSDTVEWFDRTRLRLKWKGTNKRTGKPCWNFV